MGTMRSPVRILTTAVATAVMVAVGLVATAPPSSAAPLGSNLVGTALASPHVYAGGGVLAFNAPDLATPTTVPLNSVVVAQTANPAASQNDEGYWLASADGGVYTVGDAGFYGSLGALHLQGPVVAMAATPDGRGYWLAALDGGVFAFGDASFYGSMGATVLNAPIVAMAASPSGHGYWLVGADGGIFAFGDARYEGSLANLVLAQPVLGMATTPSGAGYWLLAKDGGVFAEGDAHFYGSLGDGPAAPPGGTDSVVGLLAQADATGYTIVDSDGTANAFGS
jgi:hypothetical protein